MAEGIAVVILLSQELPAADIIKFFDDGLFFFLAGMDYQVIVESTAYQGRHL